MAVCKKMKTAWRRIRNVENYRIPSLAIILLLLVDAIAGLYLTISTWFSLHFLPMCLLFVSFYLTIVVLTFEMPRWLFTYPLDRIHLASQWDVSPPWRWLLISIHVARTILLFVSLIVGPFYVKSPELPFILGWQAVFLLLSVGFCLNMFLVRLRPSEDEQEISQQQQAMINKRLARPPPTEDRWD